MLMWGVIQVSLEGLHDSTVHSSFSSEHLNSTKNKKEK